MVPEPVRVDVHAAPPAATVAGWRSSPVGIVHDGTQCGVQLALTPRGSRAFLGLPAAALAQGVWPLDEVAGGRAHELTDRLAGASGPAGRAQVLDAVLAEWVVDEGYPAVSTPSGAGSPARPAAVPGVQAGDQQGHISALLAASGHCPRSCARNVPWAGALWHGCGTDAGILGADPSSRLRGRLVTRTLRSA